MDIGLEKLIEMIEQRLGKVAANFILGLIVLAVAGFALHMIWQYLLSPAWGGLLLAGRWLVATISGIPAPTVAVGTAAKAAGLTLLALLGSGIVALFLGRFARVIIADYRLARDIRNNPESIWSEVRANKAVEDAWMGKR